VEWFKPLGVASATGVDGPCAVVDSRGGHYAHRGSGASSPPVARVAGAYAAGPLCRGPTGEIRGLEWSRVDFDRNRIVFAPTDQKNGKFGAVPLNHESREALLSRERWIAPGRQFHARVSRSLIRP
jgi:integrase